MSNQLRTEPNLERPDEFYEALLRAHDGRDGEAGRLLDARLILLLANHIGEHETLLEAIRLAANASE